MLRVKSLFVYPIKSLPAIPSTSLSIDQLGPVNDRRLMLVNEENRFISLRSTQSLVEFDVSLQNDQLILGLGSQAKTIDLTASYTEVDEFSIWNDMVKGAEVSHDLSNWISDILEKNVRLITLLPDSNRSVHPDFSQPGDLVSFADGFPFLFTTEASCDHLGSTLGMELDPLRFRPNVVIEGAEPWEEDTWRKLSINGIEFDLTKPCSRCGVPSVHPTEGSRQTEVTKGLVEHRRFGKKTYFGMNGIHRDQGMIKVGDEVQVLETGPTLAEQFEIVEASQA